MRVEILQFRYDFILNPQHNNAYMQVLSDLAIKLTGGPDAKETSIFATCLNVRDYKSGKV